MTSRLGEREFCGLRELLADAETCARLSDWEEEFLSGVRDRVLQWGDQVTLSDKQRDVLKRIEGKVYAT